MASPEAVAGGDDQALPSVELDWLNQDAIHALSVITLMIAPVRERIMPLEERRGTAGAPGVPPDHRANRFLTALELGDFALLEPHLEAVDLPLGTVLYEMGDPNRYTYLPHDAIVSLVDVMEDGRTAEVEEHKDPWGSH
jgi:hypothetical protein